MTRRAAELSASLVFECSVSQRERELAVANARVLWVLLGGKIRGKAMRVELSDRGVPVGSYRGDPHDVELAELEAHFAGEISLGLMVVANDRTRLMAFDLDEQGGPRARILAQLLAASGYGEAMIATTGSDEDRAKVVVFFERSQPAPAVNRLAYGMLEAARRHPQWGIESRNARVAEVRPSLGDGGVLRIGGRHLVRGRVLERYFDPLTGEVAYLSRVRPADVALELEAQPILVAPQQAWVQRWIDRGRSWSDAGAVKSGTLKVNADLMRLAHEAYRLRGPAGREMYREWVEAIWSASRSLHAPSPTNRDRRPVMGWERRAQSAWIHVMKASIRKRAGTLHSPPPSSAGSVVCPERLETFREFLEKRGCSPVAFQVSYRELGRFWGIGPKSAWRQVQQFVESGALVILDRGTPGSKGDKTIYALPTHGVEAAHRAGEQHHMLVARRAKRAAYAALKAERGREEALRRRPVPIAPRQERRKRAKDGARRGDPPLDELEVVQPGTSPSTPSERRYFVTRTSTEVAIGAEASPEDLLDYARRRGLLGDPPRAARPP